MVLQSRPEGLPPSGLADGLRRIARVSARADARRAEWLAEAERTNAAQQDGFRSTTEWLAVLSGEPVPVSTPAESCPLCPPVATARDSGPEDGWRPSSCSQDCLCSFTELRKGEHVP